MGVTRLTAYIIATRGDDIHVSSAFDSTTGKWVGWITLGPEDRYRPLLDSGPYYATSEEAEAGMRKVINEITEAVKQELGNKSPIEHVFQEVERKSRESNTENGPEERGDGA